MDPAEHHRQVAARFTELVDGTTDWTAPTPVAGWVAADVVDHLIGWLTGFLAGGGVTVSAENGRPRHPLDSGDPGDPVGRWQAHRNAVQAILDAPDADRDFDHPFVGSHPLNAAIDRFYTADVFQHTWDLARATGQDDTLDAAFCTQLLDGMQQIEGLLRESGQYGPAVPVPDDADVQTRLIAFIGRDPQWRPPA